MTERDKSIIMNKEDLNSLAVPPSMIAVEHRHSDTEGNNTAKPLQFETSFVFLVIGTYIICKGIGTNSEASS